MSKKPGPVDSTTHTRASFRLVWARAEGLDPIEELNRHGFLLTPAQEKRIQLEALGALLANLQDWRPAEVLRRKNRSLESATPTDMYMSILGYIEEYISVAKEQQ